MFIVLIELKQSAWVHERVKANTYEGFHLNVGFFLRRKSRKNMTDLVPEVLFIRNLRIQTGINTETAEVIEISHLTTEVIGIDHMTRKGHTNTGHLQQKNKDINTNTKIGDSINSVKINYMYHIKLNSGDILD